MNHLRVHPSVPIMEPQLPLITVIIITITLQIPILLTMEARNQL